MSPKALAAAAAALALAPALGALAQTPAAPVSASAPILSNDGKTIGQATFTEGASGVMVQVQVQAGGLKAGWHGMHFHAKADCSDPKFMNSGAHINMAGMPHPHGLINPAGPDFGDLPNLYAAADGTANAQAFSALVSLAGAGGRPALKDADGSALVIHANPDDGVTQPIGGAGDRIACALVK